MTAEKDFNIWFILDPESAFIATDSEFIVIKSKKELEDEFEKCKNPDGIVVLAEISWDNTNSLFPGFDLANRLRFKHELLCPIVLTSTFRQEVFENIAKKSPERYNLLFGTGTSFLHIESLYQKIQKQELVTYIFKKPRISNAVLEDMREMLIQQKGFLIGKATHDLKFGINEDRLSDIFKEIEGYLSSEQKSIMNFSVLKDCVIDANNDEQKFNDAKNKLLETFRNILKVNNSIISVSETREDEKYGKVLIIEDDPEDRKLLKEKLEACFKLEITGDSTTAIEKLREDIGNEIKVVIADWRLMKYKDGRKTKYWQNYQGYQVLEDAIKSRFASLISLTAVDDKNVHQIRNKLGIQIQLFKKDHIYSRSSISQWDIFRDIVKENIKVTEGLIFNLPNGANWSKIYLDLEGKELKEWRNKENTIQHKLENQKDAIHLPVGVVFTVSGKSSTRFYKRIKSLKEKYAEKYHSLEWGNFLENINIRSNKLWNYYRKIIEITSLKLNTLEALDFEYTGKLGHTLIARRIFLALYFTIKNRSHSTGDLKFADIATHILKHGEYNPYPENEDQRRRLVNALCIKINDLKILPEEKVWLRGNKIDSDSLTPNLEMSSRAVNEEEPTDEDLRNAEEQLKAMLIDDFSDISDEFQDI